MSDESVAVGSCACGLVKYVVTLPVKWCAHCHCIACRQHHGAPVVTWFGVAAESFRLGGREHLKWFVCSEEAKRGFCTNCGTPLLFMSTRWPDEVHVTRASLLGRTDVLPRAHVHFDQHVKWSPLEDSLPRLGGLDSAAAEEPIPHHGPEEP